MCWLDVELKKGQCLPVRYKAQTPQRIDTIVTIPIAIIDP